MTNPTQKIIVTSFLSIFIVLLSQHIVMFWDNVLFASKMGNQILANGIFDWSMPDTIDPGHPPFLATIMAIGWTIFGKSLAVSHWMMLPFIFGLLWQIHSFVVFFIQKRSHQIWATVLVLADPTLLSQFVLVNPEIIQLFFFFLALNSLLRQKTLFKVIGIMLLGIITYRGMMLCAGVFLIEFANHIFVNKNNFKSFFTKRIILEYFIGSIPALSFILWRLLSKGWITVNPLPQWDKGFEYNSVADFLSNFMRNGVVLVQRFMDFGRLFIALFVVLVLWINRKKIKWDKIIPLLNIIFFSTLIITIVSLIIKNPMGHRYFIISYLSIALLAFVLLENMKLRKWVYGGLLSILLLGNLIVYPDKFAQGWDASLAHIPYSNLYPVAINYMNDTNIPVQNTASFFPNATSIDNINLDGDKRSFIHFTGIEKYVFYSNVYNLSDDEFDLLSKFYRPIKIFSKRGVRIVLYEKDNDELIK